MNTKALSIVENLENLGFKTYFVGGCVRDFLMGRKCEDIDIVTSAKPEEIIDIFGLEKDPVGKSFKVCIVDGFEVATLRKDTYFGFSDKNVKVEYANTIEEDLARRDLTINSIAMDRNGNLVDPFNGKKDIKNQLIRFTGDPLRRIWEDPCRILRACRFKALIEGIFDLSTLYALCEKSELVKIIPPERIRLEILKAMKTRKPSIFFWALNVIGILKILFPEMQSSIGVDGGPYHAESVFDHLILTGNNLSPKNPLLRLTGFLHDIGKPATAKIGKFGTIQFIDHDRVGAQMASEILERFRFSNSEIEYVSNLILLHMRIGKKLGPKGFRKLFRCLQEADINFSDLLRLFIADSKSNLKKTPLTFSEIKTIIKNAFSENEKNKERPFTLKGLSVNGVDIMNHLLIKEGKMIGNILSFLLKKVIENPENNERDTLLKLSEEYLTNENIN